MTVTVTVRDLFDLGLWMTYCEASGTDEWAVNEGRMDDSESVAVPEAMVGDLGDSLARWARRHDEADAR